jgi:UDP-N-acetylmuramyl pentapeptide phosphotransferase/UDP-N-acetylglucosamine-1-phosphate transferase
MKIAGIILIIAGILMLVLKNVSFTTEKKVVDVGPIELNKKEKKTVAWPNYLGGVAIAAGVVVLMVGAKKEGKS